MATYYNANLSSSSRAHHCAFCKRNKEPEAVYKNHSLKDAAGLVTCPQLSKYRCELCGATGQFAHTRSYCPLANNFRRQCQQTKQEDIFNNADQSYSQEMIKVEPGTFRNMSKVTNSRYNSAGRLRSQYRDQNYQSSGNHQRRASHNYYDNEWPQQHQSQHYHRPPAQQASQLRGQGYNRNFAGDSL